jgi:hypothetical protein
MGKAYQAWSAASYIAAYVGHNGELSIDVSTEAPEEQLQRKAAGLPAEVISSDIDLDREQAAL